MSIVQPIHAAPAKDVVTINKRAMKAAVCIEALIVGATFGVGYLFAEKFSPGTFSADWWKMMAGTTAFAAAELSRIPIVWGARKAKTIIGQGAGWLMVGAVSMVSAFGLAQIAQQKFEPRTEKAALATTALQVAKERVNSLDPVSLRAQIKALDDRKNSLSKDLEVLGKRPKDRTERYQVVVRVHGKPMKLWKTRAVPVDWDGEDVMDEMTKLSNERTALAAKLASADQELASAKLALVQAQKAQKDELQASQMHQFAAMLMQKAPSEVTDADLAKAQFWMILIMSLAASLAGTGVAAAAIEVERASKPKGTEPKVSAGMIETLSKATDARISRALYENGARSFPTTAKIA